MENKFSLVIASLFALCTFSSAYANDPLTADMKQMSANYKVIKAQVTDASKNADTIRAADGMISAVEDAADQLPDVLAKLPDDQKTSEFAQYTSLLGELKTRIEELRDDLNRNDNAAAAATLSAINDLKTQGHQIFDP